MSEIPSIIIDSGAHTTRVGFSGDDVPKFIFPSHINLASGNKKFGIESLSKYSSEMAPLWEVTEENNHHSRNGNKEYLEHMFEHCFDLLGTDKTDSKSLSPVLMVEPIPSFSPETSSFIAQLLFEKFNIPGLYFAASPVLSSFASGKHSSIVVDIGACGTSVVAVNEGLVSGQTWQKLGGDYLTNACFDLLKKLGLNEIPIHEQVSKKLQVEIGEAPNWTPSTKSLSPSFINFHQRRLIEDFKASIAQVSELDISEAELALKPPKYYEFPSGYNRNFGIERFQIGNLLFNPGQPLQSISEQVEKIYSAIDIHFGNNVIISGGGSLLEGLCERTSNDLNLKLQRNYIKGTIKVSHASSNVERRHASWIGGSILTSLGSFHKIWVSKQEYSEIGYSAFSKRPYISLS